MVLEEWERLVRGLSPDTPVIFYQAESQPLSPDSYCDGKSVRLSQMWEGREGWRPCVLVELGATF